MGGGVVRSSPARDHYVNVICKDFHSHLELCDQWASHIMVVVVVVVVV